MAGFQHRTHCKVSQTYLVTTELHASCTVNSTKWPWSDRCLWSAIDRDAPDIWCPRTFASPPGVFSGVDLGGTGDRPLRKISWGKRRCTLSPPNIWKMQLQIDALKENEQESKGRWDTSDHDWLACNNITGLLLSRLLMPTVHVSVWYHLFNI